MFPTLSCHMLRPANKENNTGSKNTQTAHYARPPSTRSDTSTRPRTKASTECLMPRDRAIRRRIEGTGKIRGTRHYQTFFENDATSADDETITQTLIARALQRKLSNTADTYTGTSCTLYTSARIAFLDTNQRRHLNSSPPHLT